METKLPEILFITSYPPRECGIATYSHDLIKSLDNKFGNSFSLKVCALESGTMNYEYPDEVKYILDTTDSGKYVELSNLINADINIRFVVIQHEFGFFRNDSESAFSQFLYELVKPVIVVFHTVLPRPDEALKTKVRYIAEVCKSIVVMTQNSQQILMDDYGVEQEKIVIIPHGTHLVPHLEKEFLKIKYNLTGRTILSTFGLLSSGKNIETTLNALPEIVKVNPDTLFLVIGKTHPSVVKSEGEKYREMLQAKVEELKLQQHVKFINRYLPLPEILEYLQLTDIYLFTSKDPNQAVSGTFSYAISCGCPVISTPIPHAREVLDNDAGIIIDFESPGQLSEAVIRLLSDEELRKNISSNGLHRIAPTAWENSAIAHAKLFAKAANENFSLHYSLPEISLEHVKKMTTGFGMIQFSKLNQPDIDSGYTLDDNARALIALCMHFELTGDVEDIRYISIYLEFIKHCLKDEGYFLNYVDADKTFTEQNETTNLADSNGRAIWALGYLISKSELLPSELVATAEETMQKVLLRTEMMHSTRAMAFAIKGLYYSNLEKKSVDNSGLIKRLANRLVQMYRHESEHNWEWFESYLTYANSILPEALLCAWLETGETIYKETAKASFDFLLSLTFNETGIKVISNKSWMYKGQEAEHHGEQPIDVAYTILALSRFYNVFNDAGYLDKMTIAFNWFLGNNHLHHIIYNPCTGGCYDGLEENHVNLNQGAESTLSYLMARLTIEKHFSAEPAVTVTYVGGLVLNV
jgi:glycosyltransferase involved in cell wall biosynthesis